MAAAAISARLVRFQLIGRIPKSDTKKRDLEKRNAAQAEYHRLAASV
ncbi:hypothetical protein [Bradyrhizobium sp. 192]|nr:hypothetical protein [Bradyrhizobium sp. 192]UPJ55381.1 hypothetical protein IVB24_22235 [Bradyrhizobium sp. 192]